MTTLETYGPNKSRLEIGHAVTSSRGERVWDAEKPLKISNSEIQQFKSDRRTWFLAYYRGLGLKKSEEEITGFRSLGTRVHAALEHYYTQESPVLYYLKSIYEDIEKQLLERGRMYEVDNLWKEYDLAHAMVEGYLEWIAEEAIDDGLEVVAAEGVVEVLSHIMGLMLRGKLDQRIVRKVDNARLFRDFKTVGNLTAPVKTLHLNEQMKFYHLLEHLDSIEKTGEAPVWRTDGALYMMLRRVKRTAQAKPPFYGQLEVRHNKREIETMWIRTTKTIEEMFDTRAALDAGGDPHYWCPARIDGYASSSDFFPIYNMFDDGSNVEGMIESYYEVVDPDARYNLEEMEKGNE
uniref:Exonuclease n=1 Tax=Micrococcus phage Kurnik TaxID=3092208 RepID=A0AAU6R677_9CAUD